MNNLFNGRRNTDKWFSFIFFVLLVFLLNFTLGCSDEAEEPGSKELFSKWTSTATGVEFDFTGLTYGPQAFRYYIAVNVGCDCTLEILGSDSTGTASLSACTHFGPTDYCSPGTTIFSYTNENARLTLCDVSCEEYR